MCDDDADVVLVKKWPDLVGVCFYSILTHSVQEREIKKFNLNKRKCLRRRTQTLLRTPAKYTRHTL